MRGWPRNRGRRSGLWGQKPLAAPDHPAKFRAQVAEAVRGQFLQLNPERFRAFLGAYEGTYGAGARAYLVRAYPGWQANPRRMTGKMCARILSAVPQFLSMEEQVKIVRELIPLVVHELNTGLAAKTIPEPALSQTFNEAVSSVVQRQISLGWIGFSPTDLDGLVDVMKFTIADGLVQSYNNVVSDLTLIHSLLVAFPPLGASYRESALGLCIQVARDTNPAHPAILTSATSIPAVATRFQPFYREILQNHLLSSQVLAVRSASRAAIALQDAMQALDHSKSNSAAWDVDCLITAEGAGGTVDLAYRLLSKRRLLHRLFLAAAALAALGLFLVAATGIVIQYRAASRRFWWILVLPYTWVVVYWLVRLAAHLAGKINQLWKEFKKHGE